MAFELKRRCKRDESYNSSLSINTFGPKSETKNSPVISEFELTGRDSLTVGSLITLIDRQPRKSSDHSKDCPKPKTISNDPLTFCSCKCLLL